MALAAARPFPKFKAVDSAGNALAGGKLYTYSAGTSTPLATYTTSAGNVANANPVILDANGEADVWYLARQYKVVLKDSSDVTQWTVDNFDGSTLTVTGAINELKSSDIASAASVDLDAATGNLVHITGTTNITGFILSSGAERVVVFDGALTITHNASTLILPGGQNITTAAGDRMIIRGDGTNAVRVIAYIRAGAAVPNQAKGADIASASTVNLDAATGDFVHITGTTTITAITLASGHERTVVFDGALTLTYNATTLILPGGANIVTAAGDRATFRGDGSGNTRCIHYTRASGVALAVIGTLASLDRRAISTTDTIGVTDIGNLVDCTSGTFTLAFAAAATLGDKSAGFVQNSSTSGEVTLDPNGAETIDGLTSFILYPGEIRQWYVEGSTIKTILITPGSRVFTSSGTFVAPPGTSGYVVDVIGGGGGSGSGRRGAAGSVRNGGCGGGGGARVRATIPSVAAGTSVTVTVGAGGTAGAAATADDTNGNPGGVGGTSSFGTYVTAYGGGGGAAGAGAASANGGSGGGSAGAGSTGDTTGKLGGLPALTNFYGSASSGNRDNIGSGGAGTVTSGTTGCAEWGGAGGACRDNTGASTNPGGSSLYGGGGGGVGGGITTANALEAGTAGGKCGAYTPGSGGAGGASGVAGTTNAASTTAAGDGGGGGGSHATTPGAGAAGSAPGGGAGGGGASTNGANSGAGAVGGRGEVRVYWF